MTTLAQKHHLTIKLRYRNDITHPLSHKTVITDVIFTNTSL